MPKHEIIHKAGEPVRDDVRWIIDKYFNPKEIEKLERLGGRILISIAAPYKRKIRKKIVIDESFISELKGKKKDTDELKKILDELSVKHLKALCLLINQPVRTNDTAEEIKREIIRNIQAEDYWKSISQKPGIGVTS